MNRKIIVLLIMIGLFAIVGIGGYAYTTGMIGVTEQQSEIESEANSEVVIEPGSAVKSETEGVDTEVPSDAEGQSDAQVSDNVDVEYDENGDRREDSKYLDDDGDTVANYFDICPDVDDFSNECETDAYSGDTASTDSTDTASTDVDKNGVARADSTYLDDDSDTVANFYDICPGVDDFSTECDTDAYN